MRRILLAMFLLSAIPSLSFALPGDSALSESILAELKTLNAGISKSLAQTNALLVCLEQLRFHSENADKLASTIATLDDALIDLSIEKSKIEFNLNQVGKQIDAENNVTVRNTLTETLVPLQLDLSGLTKKEESINAKITDCQSKLTIEKSARAQAEDLLQGLVNKAGVLAK